MRAIVLFTIIFLSFGLFAAKGIKCKVYQEYMNESKVQSGKTAEFELTENNKKTTYLNTVISNLDTELTSDGVKLAVKNGKGKHHRFLKFKKGQSISETFEFASDRPGVIRNTVKVDCL